MFTFNQGEQFQLRVQLRDKEGNNVNPNLSTIKAIKLFITSKVDARVYAQFSRDALPGFITAPVVDGMLILKVPKSATLDSSVGAYQVQAFIHYNSSGLPADEQIRVRKADLYQLNQAIKEV